MFAIYYICIRDESFEILFLRILAFIGISMKTEKKDHDNDNDYENKNVNNNNKNNTQDRKRPDSGLKCAQLGTEMGRTSHQNGLNSPPKRA